MFFVSLHRPTPAEEQAVCAKGSRCVSNGSGVAGSRSSSSPPDAAHMLAAAPPPPCSLGFNFSCAGSSLNAPPLPQAARDDGWWAVDHERVKVRAAAAARLCCANQHTRGHSTPARPRSRHQVGYGKETYESTKKLLQHWGQFQLPWAQVSPDTPLAPGTPVCVSANVFGLWTGVPLKVV